jgi:hypothetical protein
MCIIIDANTFAAIFDPINKGHIDFKPVYDWIVFGRGKIVYGGKKYKSEVKNVSKYFGLFV